ncbi:Ig-like domain-containing protein [uncultured Mucilaginibacter sp.]|uniref:Ig-like domain-containing protein n=1 Tax=uncultured Mucilaginibacter sp. TaxID=797541 RepID=UPI0025D78333|nr:Ig-like domain-containing protein [uncultured Mucilaginibacter sp.]
MNPVNLQSIKLSKDTLNLFVGVQGAFIVTISPSNTADSVLLYSSSDTSIAKVRKPGIVSPVKAGTCIVTVKNKANTVSATCIVNVIGIKLNKTLSSLVQGTSDTLTATIIPSTIANKNIIWSSSDTSIVKVNALGIITAKHPGNAIIRASAQSGFVTADCRIYVIEPTVTGEAFYTDTTVNNVAGKGISFKFVNSAPYPVQILEWYVSDSNGKKIGDIAGSPIEILQPHAVYNSPVQFFESSLYTSARGGLSVCPLTVHFVYNENGAAYNMVFTYPINIILGL